MARWALLLLLGGLALEVQAQGWGRVTGRVTDAETGAPLSSVTVLVDGTNYGTATDEAGRYQFRLPAGRYVLRFSAVGYTTHRDSISVVRDQTTLLNVALRVEVVRLEDVTVEARAVAPEAGVFRLDPETAQRIPTPLQSGFQALKVLPGVVSNNELSYQYSVRGGGYNENLVFIDGFEVYLPFRAQKGEQEGLGLLNLALTERVALYAGGFPARYGGKLASALEVAYRRPYQEPLQGSATLSLLDAGMAAGASAREGKIGWMLGVRKARARRFFSTQELKGNYQPDYTDVQGTLTFRPSTRHTLEFLGIAAHHDFLLDPGTRKTYFGTVSFDPTKPSNLESIWLNYDGQERAGFRTNFGGARWSSWLSSGVRLAQEVAYFETVEEESRDVRADAVLYQVDPGSGAHVPEGAARQRDFADNQVQVRTWTATQRWQVYPHGHALEGGAYVRHLVFTDRLDERSIAVGADPSGEGLLRVVLDSLNARARLRTWQAGGYVQDAIELLPENRLLVTLGARLDYFDFNGEWTLSPRLSVRYKASELLTLTGAWGIYYQPPFYQELRGQPTPERPLRDQLNRKLKAQLAHLVVAGAEYFLPRKRLYLRAEAYWKDLARLISYEVENVHLEYSGLNDSYGYAYGLDVQVRGEFVPGVESWVNYSFLVAREHFLAAYQNNYNRGWRPRPTDQRHTLSLFVQDYVPGDPTWKLHLRILFGSGLPYTPPVPGQRVGTYVAQVPGPRMSARYPEYQRVDMGAAKTLELTRLPDGRPLQLELTAELLNVFDMTNTVDYTWIPGQNGIWKRIPTRLTPRTVNVRLRVQF
jgi:hypothetical protein